MLLGGDLPSTISRYPFVNLYAPPKQKDSFFLAGIIGANIDSEGILVPFYDYAITYIDKGKIELKDEAKEEIKAYLTRSEQLYKLNISNLTRFLRIKNDPKYIVKYYKLNEEEKKIVEIEDKEER